MFHTCKTAQEAKELFKKLAFRLHPDHGGCNSLMIILKEAYERKIQEIEKQNQEKQESDTDFIRVNNKVMGEMLEEYLECLLEYSKTFNDYDSSFIEGCKKYFDERGYITNNQFESLVKIYKYMKHRDEKRKKAKA